MPSDLIQFEALDILDLVDHLDEWRCDERRASQADKSPAPAIMAARPTTS
jgi:hypothetical protein